LRDVGAGLMQKAVTPARRQEVPMDYRNDRDALRGRVEELEAALDEARRGERITRLEATLTDAEVLTRQLRDETVSLGQARGGRVHGIDVLEAEVARAEKLTQRLRALLRDVERAPGEADALIQRLQRDLSQIDAVQPEDPTVFRAFQGPVRSASAQVGMLLGGAALAILGLAAVLH
jgi:chromosome segregation ATPase